MDSLGQKFRQDTAWKACLCTRISGPQREDAKAGLWNPLRTHSGPRVVADVGWQLGAWAPFCVHYGVGQSGVLHSMVAGFHRASILKRENSVEPDSFYDLALEALEVTWHHFYPS